MPNHPNPLFRMRYEDDSYQADGVQALARALEHLHLGWAILASPMRLPVIRTLLQLVADAIGFGERPCRPIRRIAKRRKPVGWFRALV